MSDRADRTPRPIEPRDRRDAAASVARAFAIDPLFDHFTKDLWQAQQVLPKLFAGAMRDLVDHGRCWVAEDGGVARGFAGWLPPEAYPLSGRREAAMARHTIPMVLRSQHPVQAIRLFAELQHVHPKEPHWYLSLLAVDPTRQGQGLGGALIRPGLAAADDEGLPAYLETQKEANVPWYGRFGFELTRTVRRPGTPPVWCMTRPAR